MRNLCELRRMLAEHLLERFAARRMYEGLDTADAFMPMRWGLMNAAVAACEYADAAGPMAGDERLKDMAVALLEEKAAAFDGGERVVGDPSSFFTLVSFTRAVLNLKAEMPREQVDRLVQRAVWLYDAAAAKIPLTFDYLNARALEAVSCLNLHRLTGQGRFMDRCTACLDNLVARQYECGAQPYHTGSWVWGRKPTQVYQYLAGSMMLYLGRELGRQDAVEYVRRLMDYSLLATNRRGEAFVTTFEGLHKAKTNQCTSRQWFLAMNLGDERFAGLARTTYGIWAEELDLICHGRQSELDRSRRETFPFEPMTEALWLGVRESPMGEAFVPEAGQFALPDISIVFIHEKDLDVSMGLLGGYTALAEADCGDVKLFALTPELSDEPTYVNAGIDALRAYYQKPSEQIECSAKDGKTVLSGWIYTKWDRADTKDFRYLHNRRLGVTMTYHEGEMVLEYETLKNWQQGPVPSRLLFLLLVRPDAAQPRLRLHDKAWTVPAAESTESFFAEAAVGPVRFAAPDGSAIEIIPELCMADRLIAERPTENYRERLPGEQGPAKNNRIRRANEGSVRVAFDGPNALDRGRYRIRFLPAHR